MPNAARQRHKSATVAQATANIQNPPADSALLVSIAGQALAEMGVSEPSACLLRPIAKAVADLVCTGPACSPD